jgi:hypothetical protein
MASDIVELGNGDSSIRIEGLNRTIRSLKKAGTDAQDLKDLMHAIGEVIVRAAQADVPKKSGALAQSIRAGRGATKAVVRAGSAKVPYAGPINYGWAARNIRGGRFLNNAANSNQGTAVDMLDRGIQEIIKRNDLA